MINYIIPSFAIFFLIFAVLSLINILINPVAHYNLKHAYYWWLWLVKNKKIVYLDIKTQDEFKLIHELGYYNGKLKLLIELREPLFNDHSILIYYPHEGFTKRLVFRSEQDRTMFILKYWNF